jgi:hypothetical protein
MDGLPGKQGLPDIFEKEAAYFSMLGGLFFA